MKSPNERSLKIAEENAKKRRGSNKRQMGFRRAFKQTLNEPLEIGGRVLVKNLTERGGSGKNHSFWEQKIYGIKEKKDQDIVEDSSS